MTRKKLAPNLLLLSSHEVDLFGQISKGSLNPAADTGNDSYGRGIYAFIHGSYMRLQSTSEDNKQRDGYVWDLNSRIRDKYFAK